jgi:hypothetical protein
MRTVIDHLRKDRTDRRTHSRLQDHLSRALARIRIKVAQLNRRCLLKQRVLLQSGGDEARRTLISVLGNDVPADRTAFIQDKAIVILCNASKPELQYTGTETAYAQCRGPAQMAVWRRTTEICVRPW